jgi:hypothetical protein
MFPSNSHPNVDRLAELARAHAEGERLVWRSDLNAHVLAERIASRLQDRIGSWSSGLEFQVATTSDPWARVLTGHIAATPDGSVLTASAGNRTDVRDIMRFGGLMLLATLGLLGTCCGTQLEGRPLVISLTAVALAGVVAWGTAQGLHAALFGAARSRANDEELALVLRRILSDASA